MKEVRIDRRGEPFVRATDEKGREMALGLCEQVGLNPATVTDIRADLPEGPSDEVTVTATVVSKISRADFDRILNES